MKKFLLNLLALGFFTRTGQRPVKESPAPPVTREYKVMTQLLADAQHWAAQGEFQLERETLGRLAAFADGTARHGGSEHTLPAKPEPQRERPGTAGTNNVQPRNGTNSRVRTPRAGWCGVQAQRRELSNAWEL